MTFESLQICSMLNLAFSMAIVWSCICRLNSEACKRHKRLRAKYALLLTGAVATGAQPILFHTLPGPGETIFAAAVLAGLLIGVDRWVHPHDGEVINDA